MERDSTEVNVPEKIGKDIVREIGERAFSPEAMRLNSEQRELRKVITKITLPETVNVIGDGVFYDCERLFSVNISEGVKSIGTNAFWWCFSLEEMEIPDDVEVIGEKIFSDCPKLKLLTLPQSVKAIKNYKHKGRELETVFSGDEELTVRVKAKSYAERYCKRNEIPYVIKED